MNGWQRLFCVTAAIFIVPALALWWLQRPSPDDEQYAMHCMEPGYVTPEEAAKHIAQNTYREYEGATSPECLESLRKIATRADYATERAKWRSDFQMGALVIGVFLAILYAMGWALGWVWRGFRPKQS